MPTMIKLKPTIFHEFVRLLQRFLIFSTLSPSKSNSTRSRASWARLCKPKLPLAVLQIIRDNRRTVKIAIKETRDKPTKLSKWDAKKLVFSLVGRQNASNGLSMAQRNVASFFGRTDINAPLMTSIADETASNMRGNDKRRLTMSCSESFAINTTVTNGATTAVPVNAIAFFETTFGPSNNAIEEIASCNTHTKIAGIIRALSVGLSFT